MNAIDQAHRIQTLDADLMASLEMQQILIRALTDACITLGALTGQDAGEEFSAHLAAARTAIKEGR